MCYHSNRLIEAILMSALNIPFSVLTKKIKLNYSISAAMGLFSYGLKNEFETAVVNEPSVFEPLKFYCKYTIQIKVNANTGRHRRMTCGTHGWIKCEFTPFSTLFRSYQDDGRVLIKGCVQ